MTGSIEVLGRTVTKNGAKGDPCAKCKNRPAIAPMWVSETELSWLCSYCDITFATEHKLGV